MFVIKTSKIQSSTLHVSTTKYANVVLNYGKFLRAVTKNEFINLLDLRYGNESDSDDEMPALIDSIPNESDSDDEMPALMDHIPDVVYPDGDLHSRISIGITDSETVRGYRLYTMPDNMIDGDYFEYMLGLYNDYSMTDEQFYIWYDENVCTGWKTMDRHGNDQSYSDVNFEDNFKAFKELPFSFKELPFSFKKLPFSFKEICKTIDIGCSNCMESVRYTNSICEWMKRKQEIISSA